MGQIVLVDVNIDIEITSANHSTFITNLPYTSLFSVRSALHGYTNSPYAGYSGYLEISGSSLRSEFVGAGIGVFHSKGQIIYFTESDS